MARPAGLTTDDVLVAQVLYENNLPNTVTPPSGWIEIRTDEMPGDQMLQILFYKVATASEPADYTFNLSTSHQAVGGLAAFRGVDTGDPINAHGGQTTPGSSTITAPSIATSVAETTLVGFFGIKQEGTIDPPPGMTERWDEMLTGSPASDQRNAAGATEQFGGPGPTGTREAFRTAGDDNIGQLIALAPAPASGALGGTYSDDFQTKDFTGSTGALPWTGPWVESGESDGAAAGIIRVVDDPNCYDASCLVLGKTIAPDAAVTREANLAPYASATLRFDYIAHRHGSGAGTASLEVSDGSGGWAPLDTWSLGTDLGDQVGFYDLSPFRAADTRIRFTVTGSTDDSHLNVDNLVIETVDWAQQSSPTSSDLFAVQFPVDEYTGFAAGDNGVILRTVDGGDTWVELLTPTTDSIRDLNFPEDTITGFAVGANDTILKTTNGGATWVGLTTPTSVTLLGVDLMDNLSGFAVGNNGTILKTADGGATWVQKPSGSAEALREVAFPINDQTGYAVGDNGTILKTADGGDSWSPQTSGTSQTINGIYFPVDTDNGYAVASGGEVLSTTNGGALWQIHTPTGNDLHTVHFPQDAQYGHISTDGGRVIATDSSGSTWSTEPVPTSEDLLGIWFSSLTRGWVVGRNGAIFATGVAGPPPPVNQPPAFDQDLGDRSDAEGTPIAISSGATDPDASDNLIYSAIGLPDGIAIDSATGTLSGVLSANSAGSHAVTVNVTDDGSPSLQNADVFTWTVIPAEVTYLIANSGGANGGDDLLTAADRTDADPATNETNIGTGTGTTNIEAASIQPGTNVLYAVANDQLGTIDATTGVFTPKASSAGAGSGSAGLVVFDNIESLTFDPFTGDLYGTHRRGGDYEGDLLFRFDPVTGAHSPGVFGGDDYIPIQPSGVFYHSADLAFDPTDGQLYMAHWAFLNQWSIATLDPETGASATVGIAPDDIVSLAFDEAGRLYTSTETGGAETLYELDKTDGSVVSSIVIDNGSNYEAMAIAFPANPNRPPAFDQDLLDRTDPENTVISLLAAATDPDAADSLTYSATGLPPGLAIDPGSGLISGTISFVAEGSYATEVAVSDDGIPNLNVTDTFTWTVGNLNQAPTFDQDLQDRSDAEGTVISLSASAADHDVGDTVTYGATGLPTGLGIDTASGLISGTIDYSAAAASPYAVTITATDDGAPSASATPDTFAWTIPDTNQPPSIVNPGAQTTPELAPFTLGLSASDPDGTTPSFNAGGTLPTWATLIDNGDGTATISGTPGAGASGTSTVTITVSDGGVPDLTDNAVFDLTVTNTNLPPTIVNPGSRTIGEGSPISVLLAGSDPDGTTVSFSDSGSLPAWATLTDNGDDTAIITGTPGHSDAATTAVTITVTDGSLTDDAVFDIIVTDVNRPPIFDADLPDRGDAEGAVISLPAAATDPDLDNITYSATGLPPGVAMDPGTGLVGGTVATIAEAGSPYAVTLTATDSGTPNLIATDTFTWVVTNTNQPPVLASIGDQLGPEETEITFTAMATDPDGDGVEFSLAGAPAGAVIDTATGVFAWTPAEVDGVGSHTVTVIATDDGSPQLTDSQVVTITVTEANRPPTIETIADQTSNEGSSVSLAVVASDPDLPTNHLSFSASGLPPGLSISSANGLISGTVSTDTVGVYAVTIGVTDNAEPPYLATTTFEWTITDTNKAPRLGRVSDQFGDEQTTISFTATATDEDGDNLTYSLTSGPAGARIGAKSGVFTWTPGELDGPGTFSAVVLVTDDGTPALGDSQVVSITVGEVNLPPTVDPIADQQGNAGDEVELAISATDPDLPANEFTLSATGLPPGLFLNPATGAIGGTLQASEETIFAVELTVTDHGIPQLSATTSFRWTVSPGADEPDTAAPPTIGDIGNQYTDEGSTVSLAVPATSSGTLTYAATGLPPGLTINPSTGSITGSVGTDAIGTHGVVVTVTDDATPAQLAHSAFTWTVTDVAAADDKDGLVQALDDFAAEIAETTGVAADQEPVRRSLVVMGSAAAATTESLRWPFALLAALLVGFATVGRVGLYPLLWRGDRQTGTITLYDPELLFGLIEPDEGGEAVHVHANAFPRRMRPLLQIGMRVRYRVLASDNRSSAWGATADE
ncbi:MAG: cold shock domain-containing protein [bacterium]|nr:cold shock domain-containing protein [bacterium]